jgi:hypothetical protein
MVERFQTIQIGGLALKAVQTGASGKALGVTSKGIFLKSGRDILFITEAPYKSPFNLQIEGMNLLSEMIQVGDEFNLTKEGIDFAGKEVFIEIGNAAVWIPRIPIKRTTTPREQRDRMGIMVSKMNKMAPDKGWLFLGNPQDPKSEPADEYQQKIFEECRDFKRNYVAADLSGCLEHVKSILGLGGGLTPSGDDWITGFFLLQTRINLCDEKSTSFHFKLGRAITDLAFIKTTTISANRIEAACQGWAEELFLDVIDYLLNELTQLSELRLSEIAQFGHSSGVDTCLGIFAALETNNE